MGAAISFLCPLSLAQTEPAESQDKPVYDFVQRIPEAPAAAALDIARSDANPTSVMRRLSLEMLNSEEATGFAAETSPYLIFLGLRYSAEDPRRYLTSQDYQSNFLTRSLANISLSAAAVRSDSDKGSRAAIALRWTAFNFGDPYNAKSLYDASNNTGCIADAISAPPPPPNPDTGVITTVNDETVAKDIKACIEEFDKSSWNATSLQFSAVQLWNSPGGGLSELGAAGQRYAAVFSYGFEDWAGLKDNSQLLLNVGHGENVRFVDEDGNASRRDETRAGVRLRIAPNGEVSGRDFNISAEAGWSKNSYATLESQEEWTYRLGAEWRIADSVWLSVSGEERSGDSIAGDESRVGLQLRWALGDEAQFGK